MPTIGTAKFTVAIGIGNGGHGREFALPLLIFVPTLKTLYIESSVIL